MGWYNVCMKEQEKILKALANSRRLQIMKYIKDQKRATVGDIAIHIKLSFKSTSKHLVILYSAGILDKEQKSLMVFYFIVGSLPKIAKQILDTI